MSRGFVLSTVLHVVGFALVLLGPPPRARSWDLLEKIPVDLVRSLPEVPAPREPRVEPPPPEPTPPVTKPLETPEPDPPEVEETKPPEPTPAPPPKRVRPPRKFQRIAHRKDDPGPSFADRLRQAVEVPESADPPPEEKVEAPVPEPAPSQATTEVEAADFPFAWYLNTLRTKITDAWDPPADRLISGGEKRVIVRFRVLRDGRVTDIEVEDTTRTPGLDTSARRAVEAAQPFPPLPPTWEADVLDVAVRFTLTEGGAR